MTSGRAVPVVVPHGRRHRVGRQRPQLGGLGAVEGHHPQVVVPGPEVDERVALRVDRDRPLDQVTGRERREDVLAGVGVDEVQRPVVGAEHDPRTAVPFEDGGLPGPARAAPGPGALAVGGLRAHGRARVGPLLAGLAGNRALAVVAPRRVPPEREQALDGGVRERLARRRRVDPAPEGRGGRGGDRRCRGRWWRRSSTPGTLRSPRRGRRRPPPASRRRPCPPPRGRPRRPGPAAVGSPPGRVAVSHDR